MDYNWHYNQLVNRAKTRFLNCYTEEHHIVPSCMNGSDESFNLVRLTPEEHYIAHLLLAKMYPYHEGIIYAANMMANRNNKAYGWIKRKFSEIHKKRLRRPEFKKSLREAIATPIWQYKLDGTLLQKYEALTDAAIAVNGSASNIKYACDKISRSGKPKTAYGFLWSAKGECLDTIEHHDVPTLKKSVHTDCGVFSSVQEAKEHYGFTSTVQVRRRCLSKNQKWKNWYYVRS